VNVADFLIERLAEWGVRRVYGYPGDGINGILGALDRAEGRIDFVQVRHEEMAAFMACAHAKWTGEVGVCLATSGPGAIHLLNGLYDAKLDHQPVVAIVGQQARAALGGDYHQEVDLISLFKDVAHEYVHMVSEPTQMRHLVDRALRIALAERTVTASSCRTTSRRSTPCRCPHTRTARSTPRSATRARASSRRTTI
jgi:pyruvate dehydrogenase (quinone)